MATTKEIANMLRGLANKLETNFKGEPEVVATLTMVGKDGPNAVFPVESISSRQDQKSGLVIVDFECPEPAGDFIRSHLMCEAGQLIQMAAEEGLKKTTDKFRINEAELKSKGITVH